MDNDYILRGAAKVKVWKCPETVIPTQEGEEYLIELIDSIHAADVRPVVRGEWIKTGNFDQYYQPIYECSHCHREVADYFMAKHLFCLHCGADMRKEKP